MGTEIRNVMSIDVEDYFHVSALSNSIARSDWDKIQLRVEANTDKLLELFAKYNAKSTFFVLGWVAERVPQLIRRIADMGHEIASHGYSHQLIYKQQPEVFREETFKSKQILEDIIQKEVLGYRAASYSITKKSLWALDTLIEAGFKYDSSIFPVKHDRYGIPDAEPQPHVIERDSGTIVEYPLSTYRMLNVNIPIAGGGYFRLYPLFLSKFLLTRYQKSTKRPFVFYLHPWEVDPEQPRVKASLLSRFRHYNNLDKCEYRLENLLKTFSFITAQESLQEQLLL